MKWKLKTASYALLAIAAGVVGLMITYYSSDDLAYSYEEINIREEISLTDIQNLSISTDVIDIKLKPTDTNIAVVHLKGKVTKDRLDQVEIDTRSDSDTVEIMVGTLENVNFNMNFTDLAALIKHGNEKLTAEIEVPKDMLGSLSISSNIGEIEIKDMVVKQFEIESNTGDIELNGFTGDRLKIKSQIGDIELERIQGEIVIETDTGEIDVWLNTFSENIDLTSDIGEISLMVAKLPKQYSLDLSTDIGDITLD
jgi:lia operon protein LiaG